MDDVHFLHLHTGLGMPTQLKHGKIVLLGEHTVCEVRNFWVNIDSASPKPARKILLTGRCPSGFFTCKKRFCSANIYLLERDVPLLVSPIISRVLCRVLEVIYWTTTVYQCCYPLLLIVSRGNLHASRLELYAKFYYVITRRARKSPRTRLTF